jgi:hypothetical protein
LGFQGYSEYVAQAAWSPPALQVVPVVVPVQPTREWATLVAWVSYETTAVYATTDFLATAGRESLKYVAYHEVCHIRLGHNFGGKSKEQMHQEVDQCLLRHLGSSYLVLESHYRLYLRHTLEPLRLRTLR